MQTTFTHPTPPVPAEVIGLAENYLESIGLEVDKQYVFAFAQAQWADHLISKNQETAPPLWEPINIMQNLARATPAFELYCGGRAGTGKTDLLLGTAICDHKRGIIFRTESTQFDQLEDRSREMLAGTGASYNASPGGQRWRGIPGGRTLKFGALKHDGDNNKYYGRPYDFIGFDEIPKFKEKHYRLVWAWARAVKGQRVRIICTGNPPTEPQEMWVKRRWGAWLDEKHPNPARPGKLRWYINLDGKDTEVEGPDVRLVDSKGKKLKPLSRTYIPGELLDLYKGADYEASLDALEEPYRSALRDGDFSAVQDDQENQVIETDHVRQAQLRWEEMEGPNPKDAPLFSVGVDVARGGKDRTVLAKLYGNWFGELIEYQGSQTKTGFDVAEAVIRHVEDKEAKIVLDLGGIGGAPYDILDDAEWRVDGFNSSTKTVIRDNSGRLRFVNRRAEAWWKFKEALDPKSGEDIALPPDPELMADLTAPTWKLTTRGIQIEKKDDIKKRLGRSPDKADAVVMAYNGVVRADW